MWSSLKLNGKKLCQNIFLLKFYFSRYYSAGSIHFLLWKHTKMTCSSATKKYENTDVQTNTGNTPTRKNSPVFSLFSAKSSLKTPVEKFLWVLNNFISHNKQLLVTISDYLYLNLDSNINTWYNSYGNCFYESAFINLYNNLFALPTTKSMLLFFKINFIALKWIKYFIITIFYYESRYWGYFNH